MYTFIKVMKLILVVYATNMGDKKRVATTGNGSTSFSV